jgi:hypothetical protein
MLIAEQEGYGFVGEKSFINILCEWGRPMIK